MDRLKQSYIYEWRLKICDFGFNSLTIFKLWLLFLMAIAPKHESPEPGDPHSLPHFSNHVPHELFCSEGTYSVVSGQNYFCCSA